MNATNPPSQCRENGQTRPWTPRKREPKKRGEITHNPRVWLCNPRPHRDRRVLWYPRNWWENISYARWIKSQNQKNKRTDERHQPAKSVQRKWPNQAVNTSKEGANKKKSKKKTSPLCPLHVPGHDMNLCKVMLAQSKSIKLTWLTDRGSGAGRVRFQGAKKRPAEDEDLNSLVANTVKAVWPQTNVIRSRPWVTPAHKTSRSTSNSKPSRLGKNYKQPVRHKLMTGKCRRKKRR